MAVNTQLQNRRTNHAGPLLALWRREKTWDVLFMGCGDWGLLDKKVCRRRGESGMAATKKHTGLPDDSVRQHFFTTLLSFTTLGLYFLLRLNQARCPFQQSKVAHQESNDD